MGVKFTRQIQVNIQKKSNILYVVWMFVYFSVLFLFWHYNAVHLAR